MNPKIKTQTLKGFRDFLPEEMVVRQKVIDTLRNVFESFGFQPLKTPALEYAQTLLGKYGREADRLLYLFQDRGGRKVGLRYDLTVPLARVIAANPNLTFPFKRYQIQPVWRAEKPQKGRYREFWQCDIDIVGSQSPLSDVEIIMVIYQSLIALNFKKFIIKINSRQVLFRLMEKAGIERKKWLMVIRTLDKIEKISQEKVEKELSQIGLNNRTIQTLFSLIKRTTPDENLQEIFKTLRLLKLPQRYWQFDPTLARGLDYYTGPIFETVIEKPKIGSITGGGRWDKLIGLFTGKNMPATGTSFGLERIIKVGQELNLWPQIKKTKTQILVTIFSPELQKDSLLLADWLRKNNVNVELYLNPQAKLDKQLKYANQKNIFWVAILGPDEIKSNTISLKNLNTGAQKTVNRKELLEELNQK